MSAYRVVDGTIDPVTKIGYLQLTFPSISISCLNNEIYENVDFKKRSTWELIDKSLNIN